MEQIITKDLEPDPINEIELRKWEKNRDDVTNPMLIFGYIFKYPFNWIKFIFTGKYESPV